MTDPAAPIHTDIPPVHYGSAGDEAQLAVYGVHGRTQSPEFLIELAERIGLEGISWTLPDAAEHSWYPGKFMEPHAANQPQLDAALHTVEIQLTSLLQARTSGGPPVVVLGFSQGACLLSEYLIRNEPNVDGAVLHTGGYLGPDRLTGESSGTGLSHISVEMFCADEDPWVPLHRAKDTAAEFEKRAASVTMTVYRDAEHQVNDDAASRIRGYLERLIRSQ